MKIKSNAPSYMRGHSARATAVEKVAHNLIKKYGLRTIRYVFGKVFEREMRKLKLALDIEKKEKELVELRGKKL